MASEVLIELIEYYKDKYEPTELIEHLGVGMDDLMLGLEEWIEEHLDDLGDDLRLIRGEAYDG